MTQEQEQDSHGLDLFDETASAVRGFPNAMLGYDKKAVDDYIRDIERQLSLAKHQLREVQRELTAANLRVDDTDFSRLGAHTGSLLKVAEAQAGELVHQAQLRAERLVSDARAEADRLRREAQGIAEDARQEGIASLHGLRADLEQQTRVELDAARAEAAGLREAADAHRAHVIADAERQAAALLDTAQAEAAAFRQTAEREAAEVRASVAREREEALAELASEHRARSEALAAAVDESRARSDALLLALQDASGDLRGRQQAAYAEAEDIKAAALTEAGSILDRARSDADERLASADAGLIERNEQLKRELRTLRQRKNALLSQLAQLSSLATETASEFPEDEHTGPILAALAGLREPVGDGEPADPSPVDQGADPLPTHEDDSTDPADEQEQGGR